jgi:PKHD-type hydroxylase
MRNNVNEFNRSQKFFQVYDNLLTAETLEQVTKGCRSLEDQLRPATVDHNTAKDRVCNSQYQIMNMGTLTQWIFDIFNPICQDINQRHWGLDIWGYDRMQYNLYGEGDFYDWHTDIHYGRAGADQNKLTIIVDLSHRDEYQGGELELLRAPEPEVIPQSLGRITAIPSWAVRRIRPLLQGQRRCLIIRLQGPKFK